MKRVILLIVCAVFTLQVNVYSQCAGIDFDCPNFELIVDLAVDTAGNLNLCEGEPITFINQTSVGLGAIDSFVWIWNYLANPTISQDCNIVVSTDDVTHIYSFEDSIICARPNQDFIILSVGLSAIDTNGCFSLVQSNEIVVNIRPRALFAVTNRVCEGNEVQFINQSCPITDNISFFWESQPDGQTSTEFTPDFTYDEPGTYTVTLTNSTPICNFEDSYTAEITVLPFPEPAFVIANPENGDSLCAGFDTLIVVNQSANADSVWWTVSPPAGVTYLNDSQGSDTVYIQFSETGAYTITMNVLNQQCAKDTSFIFNVLDSDFLMIGDLPDCVDTSVLALGSYIDTTFGIPGNFTITLTTVSTGDEIVFTNSIPQEVVLTQPGSYTVSVVSEGDCGDIEDRRDFYFLPAVSLLEPPVLCGDHDTIIHLNELILPMSDICYFWEGTGVFNDSLFNPSLVGDGLYPVILRDCDTACLEILLELIVIGPTVPIGDIIVCATDDPIALDELLDGNWSGTAVVADTLYPSLVSPGNYPVYFSTHADANCIVNDTINVEIRPEVTAGFMVASPTCVDSVFNFVSTSSAPVIRWYFGDGTQSSDEDPQHFYADPGSYTVSLVAGFPDGGCRDSIALEVIAEALSDPMIIADILSVGCDSIAIQLSADSYGPGTVYDWEVSDGQTYTGDTFLLHIPTLDTVQELQVFLTASNSCGANTNSLTFDAPAGFSAGIAYDSEEVRCPGDPVDFINASIDLDSFIIDYGNGVIAYNEVLDISFDNPTDTIVFYEVVIYGFNETCGWDTGTVIVPIRPATAVASALYDDAELCAGQPVQFINNSAFQDQTLLYFGDGSTAILAPADTVYYTYSSAGTYVPSVLATGCGSDSNALDPITVYALPDIQLAVVPGNPCTGDEVVLYNAGNTVSPVWTLEGDTIGLYTDTLVLSDLEAGSYTVTLQAYGQSGQFCLGRDSISFSVGTPPVFEALIAPVSGCAPLEVSVILSTSQPSVTFSTVFDNQQVVQGTNPVSVYNQAGTYTLETTATAPGGCTTDTSVVIEVLDVYEVTLTGDSVVLIGDPAVLDFETNQVFESFTWLAMDTLLGVNTSRPLITYPETNTWFEVEVTGVGNNCEGSDRLFVRVVCDELFLPDAFSPNGDGVNDTYSIYKVFDGYEENRSNSCIALKQWAVYDRWGERVFLTNDPTQSWDGTFKGKELANGLFTLVVDFENRAGITETERKEIHLFR